MGQKSNPNILRIGINKNWNDKQFEKKPNEIRLLTFKNLEIKQFIQKFFKSKGLILKECSINNYHELIHIIVFFYVTPKSVYIINKINKSQNLKINFYEEIKKKSLKKIEKLKKKVKKLIKYSKFKKKSLISRYNKTYKTKNNRIQILKSYKKYLKIKAHKNLKSIETNNFLKNFFDVIETISNKNVFITLNQINKDFKNNFIRLTKNEKIKSILKKQVTRLRKFKNTNFFKEGINLISLSLLESNSNSLLTEFIAKELRKQKRHNFFLKFVSTTIKKFINLKTSKYKGVKIKLSGRINGRNRARHKIIIIGENPPLLSLKSKINYSEETAYTPRGTIGIKIWMNNK